MTAAKKIKEPSKTQKTTQSAAQPSDLTPSNPSDKPASGAVKAAKPSKAAPSGKTAKSKTASKSAKAPSSGKRAESAKPEKSSKAAKASAPAELTPMGEPINGFHHRRANQLARNLDSLDTLRSAMSETPDGAERNAAAQSAEPVSSHPPLEKRKINEAADEDASRIAAKNPAPLKPAETVVSAISPAALAETEDAEKRRLDAENAESEPASSEASLPADFPQIFDLLASPSMTTEAPENTVSKAIESEIKTAPERDESSLGAPASADEKAAQPRSAQLTFEKLPSVSRSSARFKKKAEPEPKPMEKLLDPQVEELIRQRLSGESSDALAKAQVEFEAVNRTLVEEAARDVRRREEAGVLLGDMRQAAELETPAAKAQLAAAQKWSSDLDGDTALGSGTAILWELFPDAPERVSALSREIERRRLRPEAERLYNADPFDPRLPNLCEKMISLTAAGLEDLEQERRVLGAEAEQLKRNGVSAFGSHPPTPTDAEAPMPQTPTEAVLTALERQSQGLNGVVLPAREPQVWNPRRRTCSPFPSGRFRAAGLLTAVCTLIAGFWGWTHFHPSPVFALIDREAVETRTALLRMAYAEPGKPERPELARLDRFAIDQAVRDTLREHAAGLPVLSSAELMFPPGTDRKDAQRVLDLTPLVLTRLGIDAVDQRVLEDAAARGWMGTSGISPKRGGVKADKTSAEPSDVPAEFESLPNDDPQFDARRLAWERFLAKP
ncbi:MAG: hypothetical protein EGR87_05515 [Sutterella wadsworthensis]|nr:hypothetical protein [Sutterella wadsworthensis]